MAKLSMNIVLNSYQYTHNTKIYSICNHACNDKNLDLYKAEFLEMIPMSKDYLYNVALF